MANLRSIVLVRSVDIQEILGQKPISTITLFNGKKIYLTGEESENFARTFTAKANYHHPTDPEFARWLDSYVWKYEAKRLKL